jgi:hypothetical protein
VLHKILTAVTALAVVASLLAGAAGQAAAVTGYDSAYFGESAFLTLGPGQSGQFAVGFNNTGSTGWLTGSASQVDLAVCLPDKVTCNTTSPNAAFASAWLSSTAYATTSTTFVGPGQTGYFTYNVTVPAAAAPGTYRFNGDVALHGAGAMIHQQGYYQDVSVPAVGAPAKLACAANPASIPAGANAAGTFTSSTITVTVQDSLGNTVTTNTGDSIQFSQAGSSGTATGSFTGGSPAGTNGNTVTTTTSSGVATATLTPTATSTAGTDQISAVDLTFPTLTGCTVNLTLTAAGAPAGIAVTSSQSGAPASSATPLTITAQLVDANGSATTTSSSKTLTFTVNDVNICTTPGGTSSATSAVGAGAGSTTMTVTTTGVPGTCTVTVSGTALTSGSVSVPVTAAGTPAQVVFTSNNSPKNVPGPIQTVTQVQDAAGNRVFGNADSLTFSTTTTACAATVGFSTSSTTQPAAGPLTIAASNGARTINVWNNVAQTCTIRVVDNTATGTPSTTTTVTFTGFLASGANKLTESNSPPATAGAPLPANGVATTVATICVADSAGNTIATGTGSTDVITLQNTTVTPSTTMVTTSPQTAVNGCVSYTIRANSRTGTSGAQATDTYTATDVSRTLAGGSTVNFTKTTAIP